MKKNTRKNKRRQQRNSSLAFEKLEAKNLMAAAGFEAVSLMGHQSHRADSGVVQATQRSTSQTPTARIVNGVQTSGFPAVGLVNGNCTGTLISPTHVLTAAHCVEGLSTTGATFEVGGRSYNSVRVTTHPNYDPANFSAGSDIAIIELDRAVTNVTPMQINRTTPQIGATLTLVGFGEGGTSTGGFDPNDEGKQVGTTELEGVTADHITWNFDQHTEANTAPGDSGGPAFITVNGQQVIAGVTSGGSGEAQSLGDESFDTRVDVFADWIDGIVGQTTPTPQPPTQQPPTPQPPTQEPPSPEPNDDHADRPIANATAINLNANGRGVGRGVLESVGDRDAFKFTITEAGRTTITLTEAGSDVDTYLRVYNQQGQQIAENDDFGNSFDSRLTQRLTPGTYFVVAGSYEDSETGSYRVGINHRAEAPVQTNSKVFNNPRDITIKDAGNRDNYGVSWNVVRGMTGRVSDVNVTVDLEHQKLSDVRLILIAPNKQRIVLANRRGGDANQYIGTVFDQEARPHINHGQAPFTGSFRPVISLDRLDGVEPNGLWLLVAIDYSRGNVGTIKNFTLELTTTQGRQAEVASNRALSFDEAGRSEDSRRDHQRQRRQSHAQQVAGPVHSLAGSRHNTQTTDRSGGSRGQATAPTTSRASRLATVDQAFAELDV